MIASHHKFVKICSFNYENERNTNAEYAEMGFDLTILPDRSKTCDPCNPLWRDRT
jgi:hypothetical protein